VTRNPVFLVLAAASALGLAACASPETDRRVSASAPDMGQTVPYRSGSGTVVSVSKAPAPMTSVASASDSATAGASAPETWYRLGVRMEDGSMQYIDTNSTEFPVGTRIQLTPERLIRQP
jgi:hypothetical protein